MLYNEVPSQQDFDDLSAPPNDAVITGVHKNSSQQESYLSLKRQSQRLERLLQVMPAGVIVIDDKGIVRQANKLARQLLGEPLEAEVWRDIISRSFKPRADDGHEVSLRDGRRVKLSITPLIEETGQLIVVTDLTETRQLQARVSHMQRLSSLGKMVASLAHQIRTPLSAALLYAANLAQDKMNPGLTNKFASKLLDRLHELESQVNDMLLFAKSGEQNIVAPISIGDVIQHVESSCASLLAQSNTLVQVTIDKAAQSAVLQANATALQGALANLVQNAVQASESGTTVSIVVTADPNSKELIISCRDQGKGLPVKAANLFEPFYTTKTNGTGLGLAVVNQAVRAHKGRIKAGNHEQGGAEFKIWLPVSHFSELPHAEPELES